MSYYTPQSGDYRTYGYAGDPGFLSSLWRGVKKIAGPIIGGMIGGPLGNVVGGVLTGGGGSPATPPFSPQAYQGPRVVGQVTMPGGASFGGGIEFPSRTPKGRRYGPAIAGPTAAGPAAGAIPSGWHWEKSGKGYLVRNRRMNVANPRALRRSMRRVQGFEKLARRTITFTRRVKMKKRKS